MKRVHSKDSLKTAAKGVYSKINELGVGMNQNEKDVLAQMLDIANSHAREISKEEQVYAQAGVGAKPISACAAEE